VSQADRQAKRDAYDAKRLELLRAQERALSPRLVRFHCHRAFRQMAMLRRPGPSVLHVHPGPQPIIVSMK